MKSLSTRDVSLGHVIEGHFTESKQSPEASQMDLKGWGGVGTWYGDRPESRKIAPEWVGGTELGLPDPPLPLGSKNSPDPITRKHYWLLLSASEVHGYLEEKQYVVHV